MTIEPSSKRCRFKSIRRLTMSEQQKMKLITIRELCNLLSISRSSVYRRINPKDRLYDDTFPKPLKLGPSMTRWVDQEIREWLHDNWLSSQ
ncbi:helix-turn-helix transcriptional regulator [Hydrogenovibrio sp.]|uniref:helix-turn-helix transcriptional regulator n=1 Tax=Hydrogenovibrio sp. TaxID=2065821 RepID=UPI003860333D